METIRKFAALFPGIDALRRLAYPGEFGVGVRLDEVLEPDERDELEYVGFWSRAAAAVLDIVLLTAIALPLLLFLHETSPLVLSSSAGIVAQIFVTAVVPPAVVLAFWMRRHATPGKMAISSIIIDERTAEPPGFWQHFGRYCAYFISALPLGLGFLWIAVDPKKQGWHDKLAGTLVVRSRQPEIPVLRCE